MGMSRTSRSPLPCFPCFPVPSLSEKWPPFPSTTIRASRRCCERGRAREGERAGQRLLVHTHIFSQMNLPLLLLLYRSLLLSVASHSLDPPPNCQTTYTEWMDLVRYREERKGRELVRITTVPNSLPFRREISFFLGRRQYGLSLFTTVTSCRIFRRHLETHPDLSCLHEQ